MKEIILHIGRHKTGTTSLQLFMGLNDKLLAEKFGILYPLNGRDQKNQYHHPVFENVIAKNGNMDTKLVNAILKEGEDKGVDRILLSSEMLSRPTVSIQQLEKIRDSFSDIKIKILVYLRQQDKFLLSTYAERVKKNLIAAPKTIHDIDAVLDYCEFINKFSIIFGSNAITIKMFENAVKNGIYEDYLAALGITLDPEFKIPKKMANERWPWLYVEIVRFANNNNLLRKFLTHRRVYATVARLHRIAPAIMDCPKPLSKNECRQIMEKYRESNEKLAKEYLTCDK